MDIYEINGIIRSTIYHIWSEKRKKTKISTPFTSYVGSGWSRVNIYEINGIIRPILYHIWSEKRKKNKIFFLNLDLEILKKKFVSVLY